MSFIKKIKNYFNAKKISKENTINKNNNYPEDNNAINNENIECDNLVNETAHNPTPNTIDDDNHTENTINENDYLPSSFVDLIDAASDILNNPVNIVMNELEVWGINPETLGYKIIISMVDIDKNDPSDNLLDIISNKLNKSKQSIMSAIAYLIRKANFSKSTYDEIKNLSDYGVKDAIDIIYNWIKKFIK